jgi:hypothetical protein
MSESGLEHPARAARDHGRFSLCGSTIRNAVLAGCGEPVSAGPTDGLAAVLVFVVGGTYPIAVCNRTVRRRVRRGRGFVLGAAIHPDMPEEDFDTEWATRRHARIRVGLRSTTAARPRP